MKLSELGLTGNALLAATEFEAKFHDAFFESGKRSLESQASAMADNVYRAGFSWIKDTYSPSPVRDECQVWVDYHQPTTTLSIAAGLLSVMSRFSAEELSHLSKHLSGEAFDVKPRVGLVGRLMHSFLNGLARKYSGRFLDHEGELTIWHLQF